MGSDLRYSLINTFTAIDAFRQGIMFNLQGAIQPGFAKKETSLGMFSSLNEFRQAESGSADYGTKPQISAGPSELRVSDTHFDFTQGGIVQRNGQMTALAINGDGFFAVAESLQPGARVFLTRDGSFSWKDTTPADRAGTDFKQYNLATKQGLFVLRAKDIDLDPNSPTFMRLKTSEPPAGLLVNSDTARDGTRVVSGNTFVPDRIKGVIGFTSDPFKMPDGEKRDPRNNDSDIAILRVPLKEYLKDSSFGSTIYETNVATRAGIIGRSYADWFRAGDPVQVQSQSAEEQDFTSILTESNFNAEVANFVYKNLTQMLDNYNRSQDDLLGLVK